MSREAAAEIGAMDRQTLCDWVHRFNAVAGQRLGSRYRSGRTKDWLKFKNPDAPAVKREAEEDWGR